MRTINDAEYFELKTQVAAVTAGLDDEVSAMTDGLQDQVAAMTDGLQDQVAAMIDGLDTEKIMNEPLDLAACECDVDGLLDQSLQELEGDPKLKAALERLAADTISR